MNYLSLFTFFIFLYCVWSLITTNSFRHKFIYFYLLLLLVSVWGFYYSIEGLVFLLLLGELLIILLFILFYLTIQFYTIPKQKNFKIIFYWLCIVFLLSFYFFDSNFNIFLNYKFTYVNIGKIVSDDFFIFFYFLFFDFTWVVYFLGVILTLFSIFFIFFFLSCKSINYCKVIDNNKLYFLRKQNFTHQSNKKTTYTTFQV